MSAYIVNDNHINILVSYFVKQATADGLWTKINGQWNYLTSDNAQHLAYALHSENVRSVNHRYQEHTPEGDELFKFRLIPGARRNFTPGEIAKALDGYEYQAGEHDGYEGSEAQIAIQNMRKNLLSDLPDYEEADTWGIRETRERQGVR